MKVNQKQLYNALLAQKKALEIKLNPDLAVTLSDELPSDFNKRGWEQSEAKVEELLSKMKELRSVKGNRLTPQFYRAIYHRCVTAMADIAKLHAVLTDNKGDDFDYEAAAVELNAEVFALQQQVAQLNQ